MVKIITLKENRNFRYLYTRGKSKVSPILVIYVIRNRLSVTRIGVTASKKVGNAVMRNRSRRIITEAYRQISPNVKPGFDLVFVARGRTPFVKSTDILNVMSVYLKQFGVLK